MDRNMKGRISDIRCGDELTWQKLLDGELDAVAAELLFHHQESCRPCVETLIRLRELKAFCTEQFGLEDETETEFTGPILQRVKGQVGSQVRSHRLTRNFGWWKTIAVAAGILVTLMIPLLIGHESRASVEEILLKTLQHERTWEWQPNKVLHWVREQQVFINQQEAPEQWYRALYWRNNLGSQSEFLMRVYNRDHQLTRAEWYRGDGSKVKFNQKDGDFVEIFPPIADVQNAMEGMEPPRRQALERYLNSLQWHNDRLLGRFSYFFEQRENRQSTASIRTSDDGREVYHIVMEDIHPDGNTTRHIIQTEIEVGAFRRLRSTSTRYKTDGSVEMQYSRWSHFTESSLADFEANNLNDLIARSERVIRLSPEDLAR